MNPETHRDRARESSHESNHDPSEPVHGFSQDQARDAAPTPHTSVHPPAMHSTASDDRARRSTAPKPESDNDPAPDLADREKEEVREVLKNLQTESEPEPEPPIAQDQDKVDPDAQSPPADNESPPFPRKQDLNSENFEQISSIVKEKLGANIPWAAQRDGQQFWMVETTREMWRRMCPDPE